MNPSLAPSENTSSAAAESLAPDPVIEAARFMLQGGTLGQLRGVTPQQYEALYRIGYDYYQAGRCRLASQMFSLLFSLDPYEKRYAKGMASSLQREGRFEQALACWGATSLLDLDDSVPVLHACECLMELGRLDEALESLEPMVAPGATEPPPVIERARVLVERIRRQQARKGTA